MHCGGRTTYAVSSSHSGQARVVVVGAGLGAEVAATAAVVALVDPLPMPMVRQLCPLVGEQVAALHRRHGVRLLTGTGVQRFVGEDSRIRRVLLDDGSAMNADVVLVSIGANPSVGWLRGSGLNVGDGVLYDEFCRAAPGIYAAGDVASWINPAMAAERASSTGSTRPSRQEYGPRGPSTW